MTPIRTKLLDLVNSCASAILLGIIRIYQLALSPIMGPQCRFYPSCSYYACQAIKTHGPLKGLVLTAGRIIRCNPMCHGGHDPVPPSLNRKETA